MKKKRLIDWLDEMVSVWKSRKPEKIADLCAERFLWYEIPNNKPLKTGRQLIDEWRSILHQRDIVVNYEIISIDGDTGMVKWTATYTAIPSKEKVECGGKYMVRLNNEGRCTEFRQWSGLKN